ncbi:BLOC-1 related complex subunit 6 [Alosa sapidissima]|uniref:BLOC-1 related complex subunit 6 n=1 Tax=Alosa sapidissima TaxID=34773 RepID=UPI001C09009A|nr:BLOC-1 related complex subunit 6 [Alosa sapidissima]XP_041954718.1 BLOC-1 related complex subunit 6 [Alosa sapidissima]XP_041954719.1 BLOC-1 related complex subunit 6 [Alosa sapidissima]
MSHSPVSGQDVPEATNGVDSPTSPEISDRPMPHTLKCDGRTTLQEDGLEEETQTTTETNVDADHISNNSAAHSNSNLSHTETPETHSTSLTDTHSHTPNRHAESPPKHEPHTGEEDHNDSVFTHIYVTDLIDTATKDRPHTETHSTDRQQHDNAHTYSEAPDDDGVREEEENDRTERNDGEQGEDEKAEPTEPSSSSSSSSRNPPSRLSTSAPASGTAPSLAETAADSDEVPRPMHVMAEVRVRGMPDRVVRGMQDSKSLDELSGACGGGGPRGGARGGQAEGGRRATISSALELEGTVSHEGDLTNFICRNLEQKIKMSSRPSLDCDSDSSSGSVRGRGSMRRPADIPPIDPSVLLDLQRHTQDVAQSVELMMRSLNGTIQNMTALSVGYIQTYRDSVDSLGESVDMSIKGMYTLMARCEELDRSMQPIHTLAAQIRDIKRTLDALEAVFK